MQLRPGLAACYGSRGGELSIPVLLVSFSAYLFIQTSFSGYELPLSVCPFGIIWHLGATLLHTVIMDKWNYLGRIDTGTVY